MYKYRSALIIPPIIVTGLAVWSWERFKDASLRCVFVSGECDDDELLMQAIIWTAAAGLLTIVTLFAYVIIWQRRQHIVSKTEDTAGKAPD